MCILFNRSQKGDVVISHRVYDKNELIQVAKEYCASNNIPNDEQLEIALLDNEEAENFLEKIFNNMKVIRGLITKKD